MSELNKTYTIDGLFSLIDEFETVYKDNQAKELGAAVSSLDSFPEHESIPPIPSEIYGNTKDIVVPGGEIKKVVIIKGITVQDHVAPFLLAFLTEAARDSRIGVVSATSSYRTTQDQQKKYDAYVAYLADPIKNPPANKAVIPSKSKHTFALAIDFAVNGMGSQNKQDFTGMIALAELR